MLCQKCGHFEATVHTEETVFRQKIEQHLCSFCAGTGDGALSQEVQDVVVVPYTARMRRISATARAPAPIENVANGLAAITGYLARLYAGDARMGFLSISAGNEPSIFISRGDEILPPRIMHLISKADERFDELDRSMRDFLTRHNAGQFIELPFGSPGAAFSCPLPRKPDEAARLIIGVLANCFDVGEHDALGFQLTLVPRDKE